MKFENIKKAVITENKYRLEKTFEFIEIGSGSDNNHGIRCHSTAKRWAQYSSGEISREKAIEYATKRAEKEAAKDLEKKLARLEEIENAPDVAAVECFVDWKRNTYWGWNPNATAYISTAKGVQETTGRASGCGYDKYSAAVAEAFNTPAMLKLLCTLKETAMKNGVINLGSSNAPYIAYGAGYGAIPYFEGGVGISCFVHILTLAGFDVTERSGKTNNIIIAHKKPAEIEKPADLAPAAM